MKAEIEAKDKGVRDIVAKAEAELKASEKKHKQELEEKEKSLLK